MATPIPPDIRVRIYQLEENVGGTDLQKKSSPAQVEYSSTASSPDFRLISLSDVSETIEIDKGVYLIDSMSLVIDGLSESFFSGYSDPLNEPFVCEIFDNNDSEVLFHGPIDRPSIKYDARTEYHSFDILSWTYVLEQTAAAARSIYETRLKERFETTGAIFASTKIVIPRLADNGDDMQEFAIGDPANRIVVGDIAVFDSTLGEFRGIIAEILAKTATSIEMRILGEPENTLLNNFSVLSGSVRANVKAPGGDNPGIDYLRVEITESVFVALMQEVDDRLTADDTFVNRRNNFIDLSISFSLVSGNQSFRVFPMATAASADLGGTFTEKNLWRMNATSDTVILLLDVTAANLADALANGFTINQIISPTEVKAGTKIRILGKDVYGYAPSGAFAEALGYEVDQVIEGLFSLAETGIFQYVADTFTYPAGFTLRKWHRWLEWPVNLIKSLRLMQNTEQCFLKIIPTLDGGDLPRMTVELIDRRDVNEVALGAATAITGIIDYTEDAADLTPRGAKAIPFMEYQRPHGFKIYDIEGFWYGAATLTDDPKLTVPPDGSDVVEFKVNMTPDWNNGDLWVSNEKGIWNPNNFRSWAKFFYDFYSNLPANCEFKHDGKLAKSLLGEYVVINEGGLSRLIFVTKHSYSPITRDTTISGRVGEYTPTDADSPIAIVHGDNLYLDVGATGLTDIWATAQSSYSPIGLPITYSWVQDPDGTPTVVSTDPILELTDLSIGQYVFELTVDDGTNTGSVRHLVFIGDDEQDGTSEYTEQAQITSGPTIAVDAAGDVTIILSAQKSLTQDLASITIESSLISVTGPWTGIAGSPFDNPITSPQAIFSGLAENTKMWFRIQLKNRSDGSTSSNVYVVDTNNAIGSDSDNLLVGVQLDVQGDLLYNSAAGKKASFIVDSLEYMLIDDTGVTFKLAATDTWSVENSAGGALSIDDDGVDFFVLSGDAWKLSMLGTEIVNISETGFKFTQLAGDSFAIFNDLTSSNYFEINDNGVAFGDITLLDFFKITHNSRLKFNLDANGFQFDVDVSDLYTWSINSIEFMRIQSTEVLLSVELKLNTKNISGVGDLSGTGTVSGFTIDAGGANFGPAAPASITVVDGIVTAIS